MFVVIFTLISIASALNVSKITVLNDTDCFANDIPVGDLKGNETLGANWTLAQCQDRCFQQVQCTHFTWVDHLGCFIKHADSEKEILNYRKERYGCICEIINDRLHLTPLLKKNESKPHLDVHPGCTYHGNDLPGGNLTGLSEESCELACMKEKKCTHFSWSAKSGCFLKHSNSLRDAQRTVGINKNCTCGMIKQRLVTKKKL